ncbi:Mitochondrial peculiar membrane protein 1 [Candida viswanathii]|jgi:hypothetical protein|uniref:Mitochondrial peculiar membrane protein 1 n=1 Tax=Candida viswanathii TaxID=5486 RepID=A0A367XZE6_9ASCO|nr:Mitochondrial peculiar membrane protein 1 [Candida viswanathii]
MSNNKKDQEIVKPETNDSNNDLDKYTESFDKVLSNLGTLTTSIYDITKHVGDDLNSKAKDLTRSWLLKNRGYDDVDEEEVTFFDYPSFYQTRSKGVDDGVRSHPIFGELWNVFPLQQFGNLTGSFKSGSTPFGYYVYKGPSIRYYNECLDKNGKSVWDDQGYWRCLFPNSEVPVELLNFKNKYLKGDILTKEDFYDAMKENAKSETPGTVELKGHGTFFDSYDAFLKWKSQQYQAQLEQRKKSAEQRKQQLQKLSDTKGEDFSKSIVSSSIKSNTYTDLDTNEVKYTQVKTECDGEGNCIVTKITKLRPVDSSKWTKEEEDVKNVKIDSL